MIKIACLVFASFLNLQATILNVCSSCTYSTVNAAISAAQPHDTIVLSSGKDTSYSVSSTLLPKTGIWVKSLEGHFDTLRASASIGDMFYCYNDSLHLSRLLLLVTDTGSSALLKGMGGEIFDSCSFINGKGGRNNAGILVGRADSTYPNHVLTFNRCYAFGGANSINWAIPGAYISTSDKNSYGIIMRSCYLDTNATFFAGNNSLIQNVSQISQNGIGFKGNHILINNLTINAFGSGFTQVNPCGFNDTISHVTVLNNQHGSFILDGLNNSLLTNCFSQSNLGSGVITAFGNHQNPGIVTNNVTIQNCVAWAKHNYSIWWTNNGGSSKNDAWKNCIFLGSAEISLSNDTNFVMDSCLWAGAKPLGINQFTIVRDSVFNTATQSILVDSLYYPFTKRKSPYPHRGCRGYLFTNGTPQAVNGLSYAVRCSLSTDLFLYPEVLVNNRIVDNKDSATIYLFTADDTNGTVTNQGNTGLLRAGSVKTITMSSPPSGQSFYFRLIATGAPNTGTICDTTAWGSMANTSLKPSKGTIRKTNQIFGCKKTYDMSGRLIPAERNPGPGVFIKNRSGLKHLRAKVFVNSNVSNF